MRKRDGSTIAYTYDALNRVTRKTVPERAGLSSTHTRDVYYGYDLRNLQTYARFDSASGEGITNVYDGFGRLTSTMLTMDGVPRTLSHRYREDGNRTRVTHPDGVYFTTSYDALGRPIGLLENGATTLLTASYNAAGLPASLSRGGASSSLGYDGIDRLTGLTHNLSGTTADATWTLSFNPASQIVSRTQSNDAYAWTGAYNVSRTYTVNGLNQYMAAGSASFAYDPNGNLTGDGTDSYVYDVENRLVGASGGHSATLRYDPLGRLYEVTGGGTTRFLYDGDALVAEYNISGALLRRYVHGAGVDVPLVWYEGATVSGTTRRQLFANWQGSIVAVVNGSGTLIATDSYDPWGIPGAANLGRFQYTGQAWIPELGMYHYKARIYSPTLGRFLQVDPVGYEDQMNLYAYVGNDPVNGLDPSGMCNPVDDPECVSDPRTAEQAPDLPTTETSPETDEIVVTALRERTEQTGDRDTPQNDELPIVLIGNSARPLARGRDYTIREMRCTSGGVSSEVTQTRISASAYAGAKGGGHLHRGSRDPGPGPDDGDSVAARGVVQYVGWGRGASFGAGKVEFRAGSGFTYQGLGGSQPSASDTRRVLSGMNRGAGRGTRSRGTRCTSR